MAKVAIVLFNSGGPDSLESVRPFLFNMLNDPALNRLPGFLRKIIAGFISGSSEEKVKDIYSKIGGRSPILPGTVRQAVALEDELMRRTHSSGQNDTYRVFVSMRYWHPFAHEVIADVKKYQPDEIILLPLYPQYSSLTSGSSLDEWKTEAHKAGLKGVTKAICCYFGDADFIISHVMTINQSYREVKKLGRPKLLFSAHGVPENTIKNGDPYQWQVEVTVRAIIEELEKLSMIPDKKPLNKNPVEAALPDDEPQLLPREVLDYQISYQNRAGIMKGIGPLTEEVIKDFAQKEKDRPLIIVPISFLSEHAETLAELDIEYSTMAYEMGVKKYFRVPALSVNHQLIKALVAQVIKARSGKERICSFGRGRVCPGKFTECPIKTSSTPLNA